MTTLELVVWAVSMTLIVIEPVRRVREWRTRCRPVAPSVERFQRAREHYERIR